MSTWSSIIPFVTKQRLTVSRLNEGKRAAQELHDSYFQTQTFRGLSLKCKLGEFGKIRLNRLDEIVMNDGYRYGSAGWANLQADGAVTGLGGVDTGVLANNTWYEIYALAQSSNDALKGLVLHRTQDFLLDESQLVDDTFSYVNSGPSASTLQRVAQGFQTDQAGECPFVDVKIQKGGAPTNVLWFTIEADSSGNPSGTPLATSEAFLMTYLPAGTATFLRFYFRTPATLAALTQYHLVAYTNTAGNATDFTQWRFTTTVPYSRGTGKIYNGSTWAALGTPADADFKIYITIPSLAVTLPSGYDRYCRIGFVYSDNSSIFVPFWQLDRQVHLPTQALGTFTAVVPTLVDLKPYVPPIPIMGDFGAAHSASGGLVLVSGSDNPTNVFTSGGHGVFIGLAGSGTLAAEVNGVSTEGQSIYQSTLSGTGQLWIKGFRW